MHFSEKLHELRKKHGMSQEQLAAKLGVSRQTVSKWELGTAMPDTVNIIAISKLFAVSSDQLLLDQEDPMPAQPVQRPRFTTRIKQKLFEKGYLFGYVLLWRELRSVIGCALITWLYLEALSIIGVPLRMLPAPAFILPIAASVISMVCLLRLVIILILIIKVKNLDQS